MMPRNINVLNCCRLNFDAVTNCTSPKTFSYLFISFFFQYMREIGVVQDFTSNDDVVVEYPDKRWRYNPEVLKKVICILYHNTNLQNVSLKIISIL